MKNNKDVVAGLGEIGKPILKLLSKSQIVVGYDINSKLMDQKKRSLNLLLLRGLL